MAEVCEKCGGGGWIIVEKDGLSGAERCECMIASRSRRIEESANIPPLYSNASFESFRFPDDNPIASKGLEKVWLEVRAFAREYPCGDKLGLLLVGETGTGKTHLAVAALRHLISRGFEGLFFDYQNLLEKIRSGYDANSGSSDREAYRTALDTDILMLDDLGAHRVTDWVEDTVTSILTYRCNNRKPLIATTNLSDPEAGGLVMERNAAGQTRIHKTLAEQIGRRARSRLFEMCRVVMMPKVEDYRVRRPR
jgi:DNA replication protein DnaC